MQWFQASKVLSTARFNQGSPMIRYYLLKTWVFPSITSVMPHQPVSRTMTNKYTHLALEDPLFASLATVDFLLGADVFAQISDGKRVSVKESYLIAFGSVFM